MNNDALIQLLCSKDHANSGVINPLVLLRVLEHKHRRANGAQPECIKLGTEFHGKFMEALSNAKQMLRGMNKREEANQIDLEHPHLLGLPIVLDSAMEDDVCFYVAPNLILKAPTL
jgi:hypothetical protein